MANSDARRLALGCRPWPKLRASESTWSARALSSESLSRPPLRYDAGKAANLFELWVPGTPPEREWGQRKGKARERERERKERERESGSGRAEGEGKGAGEGGTALPLERLLASALDLCCSHLARKILR